MPLPDRTNMHRRVRPSVATVVFVALAVILAAASTAGAAEPSATAPGRPRAGSVPSSGAGGRIERACTQPLCLFLLDKGRFRTIPHPFANVYVSQAINNRGEIAGTYNEDLSDTTPQRGYLRDRRGRFIRIDFPGKLNTSPVDLNDRGQIVGNYCNVVPAVPCGPNRRGFLRERSGLFTTLHVPGAQETQAFGINNRGQVVGQYTDAGGSIHGYRWDGGQFTTIDVPGAAGTSATNINDHGEIVGQHVENAAQVLVHGFLLSKGVFTTFDPPGAPIIAPTSINNRGQIAGSTTSDPVLPEAEEVHGFLLDRGRFTRIDFPGAPRTLALGPQRPRPDCRHLSEPGGHGPAEPDAHADEDVGPLRTLARSASLCSRKEIRMAFINSASTRRRMCLSAVALVSTALTGPIAGASAAGPKPRSPTPGFLLDRGRYITIEVRGARVETAVGGINERGQIVGTYDDGVSEHGFMRDQRGRIIPIDVPGARSTAAFKINNRGQIVGVYSNTGPQTNDFNDPTTGFLLDRSKLIRIDAPGAVDTRTIGLNNRGQVVGEYTDAAGGVHGFLWDKGRFTTIDGPDGAGASATDVNDRGQIIGALPFDRAGTIGIRGFLLSGGVHILFEAPGALFTVPLGINNRAQVVGFTAPDLTQTAIHGFLLRQGAKGPFTPIDFPGTPQTEATGLNDRGQIVGFYQNPAAAPDGQGSPVRVPTMMSGR